MEDESTPTLLPFEMRHLPDECVEKARRELNETPQNRITALRELRELAEAHDATSGIDFEDDFLLQFLRQGKFDLPRALDRLANFTRLRTNHGSVFPPIDSDKFLLASSQFFTVLPLRCPDGCAVIVAQLGRWDPEEISVDELKRLAYMLFAQCLRDPTTQINGIKAIYDMSGATLTKQGRHLSPRELYLLYYAGMFCFPKRYKEVHVLIGSLAMRGIWTIFKAFFSKKMRKRYHVHSSAEGLLNHFPKALLPVTYGGVVEEYCMNKWLRKANDQHHAFTARGQANVY